MQNGLIRFLVVTATMLAVSPVLIAQTPVQSGAAGAATRDLSGVWVPRRGGGGAEGGGIPGFGFTREEPEMLPWAAEKYKAARTGFLRNPFDKGQDELDPNINCLPPGPTWSYTINRPLQIVPLPDQVLILFEWYNGVRRIYTDGRGHPDGYPITWMGHSIGKWDGDTFVVETVNSNENSWIDGMGHPHSDALRVVERFRRVNPNTLEIDFLFDDPKAYGKPWTGKKIFESRPGVEVMEHTLCEDHLMNDHLPKILRGTRP